MDFLVALILFRPIPTRYQSKPRVRATRYFIFSRFSPESRGQLCTEEVCYGPAELQRLPFRRIDSLQSNNSYFINGRVAEENDTSCRM